MSDKRRLEIGAYIVITALALPSYILAEIVGDTLFRDLLVNLSATFAGVGLLFFLLNRFFGLEYDSSEKISEIFRHVVSNRTILLTNDERRLKFPVAELLQSASQVDGFGFALTGFFDTNRDVIIKRIQQGAKFRLLMIDPSSKASELIRECWQDITIEAEMQRSLAFIRVIQNSISKSDKVKGSFEVRFISWIPSVSMLIIDAKSQNGKAQVSLANPYFDTPPNKRLWLILEKNGDSRWFNYFAGEFDKLWIIGKVQV